MSSFDQPSPNQTKPDARNDSDFYESIPYTPLPHIDYRDDLDASLDDLPDSANNRATAIIALVLLVIIAATMGLLLAWGVASLQSANESIPGVNTQDDSF